MPHFGSHCHQLHVCLTLHFLWRQAILFRNVDGQHGRLLAEWVGALDNGDVGTILRGRELGQPPCEQPPWMCKVDSTMLGCAVCTFTRTGSHTVATLPAYSESLPAYACYYNTAQDPHRTRAKSQAAAGVVSGLGHGRVRPVLRAHSTSVHSVYARRDRVAPHQSGWALEYSAVFCVNRCYSAAPSLLLCGNSIGCGIGN